MRTKLHRSCYALAALVTGLLGSLGCKAINCDVDPTSNPIAAFRGGRFFAPGEAGKLVEVTVDGAPTTPTHGACANAKQSIPTTTGMGGMGGGAGAGGAVASQPITAYETSAPDEPHLPFTGGARYCIYHHLGGRPTNVQLWISFSPNGVCGGNEALPAGNIAEVDRVDDKVIILRNNSCADYYLRVEASSPALETPTLAPTVEGHECDVSP